MIGFIRFTLNLIVLCFLNSTLLYADVKLPAVIGNGMVKLNNILVGEVWICSGQSNMEWPVALLANPEEVKLKSDFPKIRLFQVKHVAEEKPLTDCSGNWSPCGPQSLSGFSAVGYFFGRELHNKLHVPIGLISSTWL